MREPLELHVDRALDRDSDRGGAHVRLLAPDVGVYTATHAEHALVVGGTQIGTLIQLGVRRALVVPEGVEGRIASAAPERTHQPLGYGEVVVELEELRAGVAKSSTRAAKADAASASRLVLRATTSGRFWHRPTPADPVFVAVGAMVKDGTPIGLLEVMKTFSHATYRAGGSLPTTARVTAVLAGDGADVRRGDPLIAVEPVS